MKVLSLQNRQRTKAVDVKLLRQITCSILEEYSYELGIHLVGAEEMASVNQTFLQHEGSTDVITFDYGSSTSPGTETLSLSPRRGRKFSSAGTRSATDIPFCDGTKESELNRFVPFKGAEGKVLHGEIFISLDDAVAQSKQFQTTWQSELVRYVIHGILHLEGYGDLHPALRKKMKVQENRLLREISGRFPLSKLQRSLKNLK